MGDSFQPDSFVADSFTPDTSEKTSYVQGMFKTYKDKPEGVLQNVDAMVGKATGAALNAVGGAADFLNAPISEVNKLLRAGAGAVGGIPGGTPLESARTAYNAPRGIMGPIEDTAMGLLIGKINPALVNAPMDAAVKGASKVASGLSKFTKWTGKKAIRVGFGPTEEAQTVLMNRPHDIARQTNYGDLADKMAETANGLSKKLTELDNQAWDTLSGLKAEPQSKLINILKSVKKDFTGTGKTKIGDADRQAVAQIDGYINRVKAIKQKGSTPGTEQFIDQSQLKDIIQSVQKDARYDLPETDPTNRAVQAVRAKFDAYLKGENPDYEAAMKPVAEATEALKSIRSKFALKHEQGVGLVSSDTTASKLSTIGGDKKPQTDRILEDFKNATGVDFNDEARLTNFKKQFTAGKRSEGSRRTVAGSVIGGAIGGGVGGFAGGGVGAPIGMAIGAGADYYGGPMAKGIIDTLIKAKTSTGNVLAAISRPSQGGSYQEIIKNILRQNPSLVPALSALSSNRR